ncbi:TOMM precursor leader peptide-binding protein [Bacillus cereus]|uniref:TOMM precursor leader peptide-binding protein n=1 Tax=Bacillus cereus TaxID=1396 RepID=UPI0010BDBAE1|nr:TOMM precursor leader peptide-binding protein [Bacillus cereus]MCU5546755.1 TOMM precursor leader peptide-binding protein [Bacillus cereus]TKI34452.1 TOMM precursor leader peptide-binding protein [Bacillus cereus]HDR7160796.1 TOMM precursor leader peptide-binding protein [Bacillus cereus]HDR8104082.1 TOMM precursor leader peptide-binding protein [Bacillus cereus]
MTQNILLIGDGLLADYVHDQLCKQYSIIRQHTLTEELPENIYLALVLHDGSPSPIHHDAELIFRSNHIPWLRGFTSFGEGIIGPYIHPLTPGCSHCSDGRRFIAGFDQKEMWELQRKYAFKAENGTRRDVRATQNGMLQMCHLICAETEKILTHNHSSLENELILLNLQTLQCTRHSFLPDPLCPVCSSLPDDTADAAEVSLQPSLKVSTETYRCRSIHELNTFLTKDYLDYRIGMLNGKMQHSLLPFADVIINMPLMFGNEGVAGRTHSFAVSEATAILEGLERYCGMSPRGKKTNVHGSFHDLEEHALNPLTLGVHTNEHYNRDNFPFKPFDPDYEQNWVWGYSLSQNRPLLVPESIAYYSLGHRDAFVYETSNGCAIGGSLEEAIFHGILEIVERDAFLLTWYAELPLPRLDLSSANDTELQLMIQRLYTITGYELHAFNATMEHGIPSLWVIAKNTRENGMNVVCAGGAHLDPIRALKSAIQEIAGMLLITDDELEHKREYYEKCLQDPYFVNKMEDHSMLYGLKETEERLHFLLREDAPVQTFQEMNVSQSFDMDLTSDLHQLLNRLHQSNLEIIVVDQTVPLIEKNGLHCVKVIIPGMLPMTFGHHLTRITGLDRVYTVPMTLGYTDEPLTNERLNPHPHPFP